MPKDFTHKVESPAGFKGLMSDASIIGFVGSSYNNPYTVAKVVTNLKQSISANNSLTEIENRHSFQRWAQFLFPYLPA